MIKKLFPYLIILAIISAIVAVFLNRAQTQQMLTVYTGNHEKKALPIKLGHYQDTQCGMPVEKLEDAAQAVAPDGKTWFFDDIGCLGLWMEDKAFKDELVIWVYAKDAKEWIDGRKAHYKLTDETPMHYGFGAYKQKQEGMIDFSTMQLKMLRNEHLNNPYTRRELLGEH
jgi:copper chaperone NosL